MLCVALEGSCHNLCFRLRKSGNHRQESFFNPVMRNIWLFAAVNVITCTGRLTRLTGTVIIIRPLQTVSYTFSWEFLAASNHSNDASFKCSIHYESIHCFTFAVKNEWEI